MVLTEYFVFMLALKLLKKSKNSVKYYYRFLSEYVMMNRKNFWEETEVTKWKILQVFPVEVMEISRQMEAKNLVWPGSGEVWIPVL